MKVDPGERDDISLSCPRCDYRFMLPRDFPGQWASCPNCGLNGGDWLSAEEPLEEVGT